MGAIVISFSLPITFLFSGTEKEELPHNCRDDLANLAFEKLCNSATPQPTPSTQTICRNKEPFSVMTRSPQFAF